MLRLRCFLPVEGVGDMSFPTPKFEGQALPSARVESLCVWFRESHPTVQCKNGNLQTVQLYKGGQPKLKNLEKNSARANRRELTGACMHFGVFRTC